MSIAVTAPQKFDFQDVVCVEMMLRFAGADGTRFLVEPKNGEDGELQFSASAFPSRMEIQVKGASGAVTLATVASCLAHTPSRAAENTLLERLIADPTRLAVLVMSGRCNDATSAFAVVRDWTGEPHPDAHITAAQAAAVMSAFAAADIPGTDGSKLRTRRAAHNATFSQSVAPAVVRAALHRLIIIEQVNEAELESSCAGRLRQDHNIPGDLVDDVLRRLRAAVKSAKADATDAYPRVRTVLAAATPASIRPQGYVGRGSEADLAEALSRDRVLLLSGTPRVGKTLTARWIAAKFSGHGYDLQEFSDVEAAERFLLEATLGQRLAVLDDPLGGSHISPDATRSLARIERLISRLPTHRRLVVAQGAESLLATARADRLDAIVTAGHRWTDLSVLPAPFLSAIWQSLADTFGVAEPLRSFVLERLTEGSLTAEPGCLEYLAVNTHRLSGPLTLEGVNRVAREDAAGLGRALADAGHESLLVALAITTTPQEPVGFAELAFARGAGGERLPSKSSGWGMTLSIGGRSRPEPPSPAYDQAPELAAAERGGLNELERRRLIAIDSGPAISFTHPFYRAAVETLLDSATHGLAASVIQTAERGLFCLSPLTSRATARNLDWVFDKLAPRADARSALVERAVHAIQDAARTDKIGDGKIFVVPIEQAIRIRTGEQGPDAV